MTRFSIAVTGIYFFANITDSYAAVSLYSAVGSRADVPYSDIQLAQGSSQQGGTGTARPAVTAHSKNGKVVEVFYVQKSDHSPTSTTVSLPGHFFLHIKFRTDDPRFMPSEFANQSCGSLQTSGTKLSAIGSGTTIPSSSQSPTEFHCIFAIPKAAGGPFQFQLVDYEPLELTLN